MLTVLGRPAYRFGARTVFADTGETLRPIDGPTARMLAATFIGVPESKIEFMHEVRRPDQWTLTLSRSLPLLKFRARDDAGTELYVSPRTAEVVLATTNRDRLLAWIGVIPHWLYFAPLRLNQPLWYSIVVYLAEIGVVMAVLGLVVGVDAVQAVEAVRLHATRFPYAGWMRWHFVTGAVFGVFTLTWVFSGLLSMEPFAWTNATGLEFEREVMTRRHRWSCRAFRMRSPRRGAALAGDRAIKEVELTPDPGRAVLRRPPRARRQAGQAGTAAPALPDHRARRSTTGSWCRPPRWRSGSEPFSTESIVERLKAAAPDVPDRRTDGSDRVRLLLLLAPQPDAVAGAAREVRRPGGDVGLRGSRR